MTRARLTLSHPARTLIHGTSSRYYMTGVYFNMRPSPYPQAFRREDIALEFMTNAVSSFIRSWSIELGVICVPNPAGGSHPVLRKTSDRRWEMAGILEL